MANNFDIWLNARRQETENALSTFLPPAAGSVTRLHEAMRYTALGGGKRIRPALVFATGELFDAPHSALVRAACAVEMIHVYSLVHDDMPCMDNDDLRRGKPTVHKKYDEATALLVGDALQTQAFNVLSDGDEDAPRKLAQVRLLAQAVGSNGMCGGQAIDLESVGKKLDRASLERMDRLKTGALLRASVFLGALCAKWLDAEEELALESYSRAIGLAFQVVDDILDTTTDSSTLGKTAGKDLADNKPTYVSILGLDESKKLAEDLLAQAYSALSVFDSKAENLRRIADLIVRRKN